jgi:hypothetical protein
MTTVDPYKDAACRKPGVNPHIFFPERGGDNGEAAKRVCSGCTIRQFCEDTAMRVEGQPGNRYRWGILAGMTPLEREHVAKQRARATRFRELGLA